jgi:hypothetical protein
VPLIAILAGLGMIVVAFRGTEHVFAQQAGKDFGQGSEFLTWFAAVTALGALGFYAPLRGLSNAAIALVIVVLVLRNGGLFTQLAGVITNPPAAYPAVPLSAYYSGAAGGGGVSVGGAGDVISSLGDLGDILSF